MKFEAFKAKNGRYRWRMFSTDGSALRVRPGKIFLPPDPEADERSRRAVQDVLRAMAENPAPSLKA